ncbi:MAG: serine/threonine-protein kinase, partial [Pseudomonadota bacterium]
AFNEERITRTVMRPLLPVLKDLAESHLTHRSFRIDNFFYKDVSLGDLMIGEGFSAPPAMYQPALFEPIESAQAEAGGRGVGSSRDDLYSFGVCLAIMILGRNPVADKTDEEIIEQKLREGTYATVLGDTRVGLGLMEPLRGLLTDDPRERWSVMELELWLNGRRLSPKQPKLPQKAGRPFKFEDKEYLTTPLLANAMTKHWTNGVRSITADPIDVWLRRGFEDEDLTKAYNDAIRQAAAFGGD